jgi:hypothetical protein
MQRAPGNAPGAAEVAPAHPMLQQHAALGVEREHARGAESTPVPLARLGDNPCIPRVPRSVRTARLTGLHRNDRHPFSLSQLHGAAATKTK